MNKYSRAFFDWLEGVSNWIDNELYRPFTIVHIIDHIKQDVKNIDYLNTLKPDTRLKRQWLYVEIFSLERRLNMLIELYNSEKYWWMKSK